MTTTTSSSTSPHDELYWLLFRTVRRHQTEILPSLAALADDAHRVDHITAKLLSGSAASLTCFTVPLHYAASQQASRASALFELLCFHPVRSRWSAWQQQQSRLYRPHGASVSIRHTNAAGSPPSANGRRSRPSSAGSASAMSSRAASLRAERVGGGLVPVRPSSALGRLSHDRTSHLSSTMDADDKASEGDDDGGAHAPQRWSPHLERRSQGSARGFRGASLVSSANSSLSSWTPSRTLSAHDKGDHGPQRGGSAGSTRSSCFTFSRSNNYVGWGAPVVADGGGVVDSSTTAPPPSAAETVRAFALPTHADGCAWCVAASQPAQVWTQDGADAPTSEVADATALIPPSKLFGVFTDYDPHGPAAANGADSFAFCALCAAQLWVQRVWVCVRLLQRMDEVSETHVSLAPFSLAQAAPRVASPSLAETLLHRFHLARRLGVLGIEAALGACAAFSQSALAGARPDSAGVKQRTTPWDVVSEGRARFSVTVAVATLNSAVRLLAGTSVVWPALMTSTKRRCSSDRSPDDACDRLERRWYSRRRDAAVVVRARLLQAALLLLSDLNGAAKAHALLLGVAEQVDATRCRVEEAPESGHAGSTSGVEASVLDRVVRWHEAWRHAHAALADEKKAHRTAAASSTPLSQDCRDDTALESAERELLQLAQLQHVLGMLVIFADLVGDRDELVALADGAADEVREGHEVLSGRRRADLATRALPLLSEQIVPFWVHVRDTAADGGATTRARHMLALAYLLAADVRRWKSRRCPDSAVPSEGVNNDEVQIMKQLAQCAIQECGAAREFISTTTTSTTTDAAVPPSSRVGDLCWRYRTSMPTSATALDAASVTTLAILPVQLVRLWLVLCPVLFPASCLAEFMQLHDDGGHEDEVDDAGQATPPSESSRCEASTALVSSPSSTVSGSRRVRTPSRGAQPRRPSSPRARASLSSVRSRARPLASLAAKAPRGASPQKTNAPDTGATTKASEAHLRVLGHRLWYSPAALPVHWRWVQLSRRRTLVQDEPRWVYQFTESDAPKVPDEVVLVLQSNESRSTLETALTAALSSIGCTPTSPARRAAVLATLPEPFVSALLACGHAAAKAGSATCACTTRTLCADLGVLYGALEGAEEEPPVRMNVSAVKDAGASSWCTPFATGVGASAAWCDVVTAYAAAALPPLVREDPPQRATTQKDGNHLHELSSVGGVSDGQLRSAGATSSPHPSPASAVMAKDADRTTDGRRPSHARSGSLPSSAPALHMRLAGRLSRRPVLFGGTPPAPTTPSATKNEKDVVRARVESAQRE